MRHHRAAAGWSSASGPAAAADRSRCVASKPARVRLFGLSSSSRQERVRGGAGGFGGEQVPPSAFCTGGRGESLVELPLEDSGGVAESGWPGGS
jgi:hypothetical protein